MDDKEEKEDVVKAIERNLAHMLPYSKWKIGLTQEPDRREQKLDYPGFWRLWEADTPSEAQAAFTHFVEKGMQPDDNRESGAKFIYLF